MAAEIKTTTGSFFLTKKVFPIVLFLVICCCSDVSGCPDKCRCAVTYTYCIYKKITTDELRVILPSIPSTTKKLYLNGNKITEITIEDFKHLTELTYLSMNFNQIEKLPKHVGDYLPNLRMLYLTANKIKEISSGILDGYEEIEVLNLDQNQIEQIPDHSFSRMSSLRELLLGQNKLKTINENTFYGLKKLVKLQLSDNNLNSLHENAFQSTPNLIELFLYVNKITQIQKGLFSGLQNLRIIYLSDNFIAKVEDGAFDKLLIETLYLNLNLLTRLPKDMFKKTDISGSVYLLDNQFRCDCQFAQAVSNIKEVVSHSGGKLHLGECHSPPDRKHTLVDTVSLDSLNCSLCDVSNSCPAGTNCSVDETAATGYTCIPHVQTIQESPEKEKKTSPVIDNSDNDNVDNKYTLYIIASICVLIIIGLLVALLLYVKYRRRRTKAFAVDRHIYEKVNMERADPKLTNLRSKNSFNAAVKAPVRVKQYFV